MTDREIAERIAHDVAVESGMAHESLSALTAVIQEGIDRALAVRVSPDREALARAMLRYAADSEEPEVIQDLTDAATFIRAPAQAEVEELLQEIDRQPNSDPIRAKAAQLLRRLSSIPPAVGEWRPIETAPKGDGDEGPDIQLFGKIREGSGYKRAFYIETSHWYRTTWTIQFMDGHEAPTHWQHLPAPPQETKP